MAELIRKLKDYEQEHIYARYLTRERGSANITPADFKEIDIAEVIDPNDTEKLISSGDMGNGFCMLPGGGVYTQQSVVLEGVTCAMLNWWYAFYPLESYRYLMWMPESHHSVAIADCDREKITNPMVPMEYKSRGVLHAMLRNEGRGMTEVNTRFLDPVNTGFDMGKVSKEKIGTLLVDWKMEQSLDMLALPNRFPLRNYAVEITIAKDDADGVHINSFCWLGWRYDCDGKAACCLPPGITIPKEAGIGVLMYGIKQWQALSEFLPALFEEENGKI